MNSNVSRTDLLRRLINNVCIVKFRLRHPKGQDKRVRYRRMLCTSNKAFLLRLNDLGVIKYRIPQGFPRFNPIKHELIIVYDILMQDFRCINCRQVKLIRVVPATQIEEKFQHAYKYIERYYARMSAAEKLKWMNYD